MYEDLLKEIESRAALPIPASDVQAKQLKIAAQKLGAEIPRGFLDFLQNHHNGFNWNGLFVYAADGAAPRPNDFVFENEGLRIDDERFKDYLVFAEDDMSYYVYCISADEFQVLDKIPLDVMDSFSTFEELFKEAFQSRL